MNKLQSNDLYVIINIQYGIGFQLLEGHIEIEITFFNKTHRSRIVPAGRNRINFYEEFLWTIDKNTLKYCQTTNEIVKLECFKTPDIFYGNIYQRLRIGHRIIKLNEFKIIGREMDESVSPRNYKLYGSSAFSSNYVFRIILTIHDGIDLDDLKKIEKKSEFYNKDDNFTNTKRTLNKSFNEQDIIENKNITKNSTNKEIMNNHQSKKGKTDEMNTNNEKYIIKKELQFREALNNCNDKLNIISLNDNQHKKSWKKEIKNEMKTVNKQIDQQFQESKECLKTNEYELKLRELLETCFKHTEQWLKIMKKIENDFDTNSLKKYSSTSICNSSTQFKSDLEQPNIVLRDIKNKLNELIEYINENIKKNKKASTRNYKS